MIGPGQFDDRIGAKFGAWVDDNARPSNAQYKYLKIDALAQKGARLPVGAIVLLDRAPDRPASLARIERAEAMDSMIAQISHAVCTAAPW